MSNIAIECRNLEHRWPSATSSTLNIESFSVRRGEQIFLYGPSGSGKSTLLSLCGGIMQPSSGNVRVLGNDLSKLSNAQLDRFRVDHTGFIFQLFNLVPYLSIRDNIVLPLRFSKLRRKKLNHSVSDEVLRLCDVLGLGRQLEENTEVSNLSIGQQQRVAAARALIGCPEIIIADEPTSALDADSKTSFMSLLLKECRVNNTSLIFVSHEKELAKEFEKTVDLTSINEVQEV